MYIPDNITITDTGILIDGEEFKLAIADSIVVEIGDTNPSMPDLVVIKILTESTTIEKTGNSDFTLTVCTIK